MGLSSDLISQFVKVTKDDKKTKKETITYGTIEKDENGKKYIKLDGSDIITPLSSVNSSVDVDQGDRVTVMIKNHTTTITGNLTNPSATYIINSDSNESEKVIDKITAFETAINQVSTDAANAQSDIDKVKTRVSAAEANISRNSEQIALRATKTEVTETLSDYYTKKQTDSALTIKANEITSNMASTYATKSSLQETDTKASNAITAAANAQSTADAAQSSVDNLETRVTTAETNISQNRSDIALRATKTELLAVETKATNAQSTADTNKTNLANNYYTKTQIDSLIKLESDKISSAVTRIGNNETAISILEQTVDSLTGDNKILWSGGWYMTSGHTATLSESISSQANGIVLVFSRYSSSTAQDYNFNTIFVPKSQVANHNGAGHSFIMTTDGTFSVMASKYLYINDTSIVGNDNNDKTGTGTSGIVYTNNGFVLRYVIGV